MRHVTHMNLCTRANSLQMQWHVHPRELATNAMASIRKECVLSHKKNSSPRANSMQMRYRSERKQGLNDAGSRTDFRTTSSTRESDFKNGHISRFYFVLTRSNLVGKVVLCARTFHALNSWIWSQERDFKGFFLEKRPWKRELQMF